MSQSTMETNPIHQNMKHQYLNKRGPVVVIEDDMDDQHMLEDIFKTLNYPNEIVFFVDGNDALEYLNRLDVNPFLILSDVNMPRINGFELRSKIHTNNQLHIKCIPYLFFTTSATKDSVIDAYAISVQGFFLKPNSYKKLENTIRVIMEYWRECIAPSEYDQ
ncbi:response regulator [soil metagenome]